MDPVHEKGFMDLYGLRPGTWSTEQIDGPGVYVLYSPYLNCPNRVCKKASTFEKEVLKIGLPVEYAEGGYFTLLFCDLL